MAVLEARDPSRALRREAIAAVPCLTVRAGASLVVRIGAVDRQSGVGEVIAMCRERDNRDLSSAGRLLLDGPCRRPPADNYYPVRVRIPERAATGLWEVHRIVLCDREGNRRSYRCGRDFSPILFQVIAREGLDSTPPRLLGVQVARDDDAPEDLQEA